MPQPQNFLQTDDLKLWHFELRLFDLTKLKHLISKTLGCNDVGFKENQSYSGTDSFVLHIQG